MLCEACEAVAIYSGTIINFTVSQRKATYIIRTRGRTFGDSLASARPGRWAMAG